MSTSNPYTVMRENRAAIARKVAEKIRSKTDIDNDFSSKGEANGYDKADLAHTIMSVMNKTAKVSSDAIADTFITKDLKNKITAAIVADKHGGMDVVAQMIRQPIFDIVEYVGWARKCLLVEGLSQGEVFKIAKDVDVLGYSIGEDGQTPVAQPRTKYVFPMTYKIVAMVEIDVADIAEADFDIFKRAITKAAWEIARLEDIGLYNLLLSTSSTYNSTIGYATLGIAALESMRYQVEQWRLTVDKFLINRAELSDLIEMTPNQIDWITQRELILQGYAGTFLNAQIITSSGMGQQQVIPPGHTFALTEGAYYGKLGERLAVTAEPYSAVVRNELKKGYAIYEIIGMGSGNARSSAYGQKA